MRPLAAFLLLAAAGSASLSPWLALAALWAFLSVALLAVVNEVRGRIEQRAESGWSSRTAPGANPRSATPLAEEVVGAYGFATATGGPTVEALTARELSILRAYPRHGYYQGIAEELGLSRNTIKNHVGSILRKTGCASLGQAAVLFALERREIGL